MKCQNETVTVELKNGTLEQLLVGALAAATLLAIAAMRVRQLLEHRRLPS